MTKDEQVQFLRDLSHNVVEGMVTKVQAGQVPDTWDGIELRRWLALKFKQAEMGSISHNRAREFNNTVLVKDL